jgi:outer membrane protein OmpA-like peptidoglycan-associated protein
VADLLRRYPETRVEISSYTDSSGSEQQNLALSQQRAQAVAELLAQKGIDPSRIEYRGYGETNFVASNATENGRQLNRRITLVIIPPGVQSLREGPVLKSGVPSLSMNLSFPG